MGEKTLAQIKDEVGYCQLLETILDHVSEAVYCSGADGTTLFANREAEVTDGINRSEIIGHKEEEIWGTHNHESVMMRREAILDEKTTYTTKNGEVKFVHHSVIPFVVDGEVKGTFSLSKDITREDDYISKVYQLQQELKSRNKKLRRNGTSYDFNSIIGQSLPLLYAIQTAKRAAQFPANVMICGETGTGKELFAQGIHNESAFKNEPFVGLNCGAIPENLLESTLFGTVKGSYTGAQDSPGLFEQAKKGTLFLDEIDSMPLNMQAKLLRVLQEKKVRRIGGHEEIPVCCRIISATNRDIEEAIKDNILRQDIYYRLASIVIELPPLRERKGDGPLLIRYFLERCHKLYGTRLQEIDPAVHEVLQKYSWPGNVRELQHVIEHAMNLIPADQCFITPDLIYLPTHTQPAAGASVLEGARQSSLMSLEKEPSRTLNGHIQNIEHDMICKALRACGGNVTKAASLLKMSRQNLQYRIKRYQIDINELVQKTCQELNL